MPRPLAFERAQRIVRRGDFKRIFAEGARARGGILVAVVRPNGLPQSRLGLSVGRVIWRSAVRRNRVRRIFREAFRLCYPELPVGVDVVLIPAAPKLVPELEATRRELVRLVHKAQRRHAERGGEAAGGPPRAS